MADLITTVLHLISLIAGFCLVIYTIMSAVRTFVLPRNVRVTITIVVGTALYSLFRARASRAETYEARDRLMALFAPITLLTYLVVWMVLIIIGYAMMFWGTGYLSPFEAFKLAGSSIMTLGFSVSDTVPNLILEFTAGLVGPLMIALLIAYLPTMYAAFSRREVEVAKLEVRAGSPPSAVEMIARIARSRGLDYLPTMWEPWEGWFTEIEESHTSLTALVFFRSPQPDRCWVTAAGAVLDSGALVLSSVDTPFAVQTALTMRAGYLCLRHVADYFNVEYDRNAKPDDPISIARWEFDAALEQLAADGVPLKADREQAWKDFRGWRVNYDRVLLALAALVMAPYAPWSSDRSLPRVKPTAKGIRIGGKGDSKPIRPTPPDPDDDPRRTKRPARFDSLPVIRPTREMLRIGTDEAAESEENKAD